MGGFINHIPHMGKKVTIIDIGGGNVAKILKVKMTKKSNGVGGIKNIYPPEYDADRIEVLAYEGLNEVEKLFCIGVVSDVDAASFLKSADITELTQTDAIIAGEAWRPQIEMVVDPNKVTGILAKQARGITLTQTELDALVPENTEIGINMSPSFTDMLNDALARH